jgi:hypothetical protein
MKKYRESLPKDSLSKATTPKIVSRNSQISSTVGPDYGCQNGGCQCSFHNSGCGTTKKGNKCAACASNGDNKDICWTKC